MIDAERPAPADPPPVVADPEIVQAYLDDASGTVPGRAAGLVRPASEAEASAFLRADRGGRQPVLPQAARSSLTGGAVPRGEVVLSVERMGRTGPLTREGDGARQAVGPGVRLCDLQERLADDGFYFPPVPTYADAMLGGAVSTNAGGAATFKYGVTRDWIDGLRVLLFNGDVLVLERGAHVVPRGGSFRIRLTDGRVLDVPAPDHRLPPLKKISAGYHAADEIDLLDLFIGAEGTLGLISEVTVRLVPAPSGVVAGLARVERAEAALDLAAELREAATRARRAGDPRGPDVRSVEWIDGRSLALLRAHGDDRRLRLTVPESAQGAVFYEMELAEAQADPAQQELLLALVEGRPGLPDTALTRLFRILRRHAALEGLELALPADARLRGALRDLREAVPARVLEIHAERRRREPAVGKIGGDLIVPFDRVREMIEVYERGFAERGLEYAIWGHLSDGNLHPNALPRDVEEARAGQEAMFEFAEAAALRGGCPLSEHGVGRSPLKQELLRRFLGDAAIARMRAVKSALDPHGRFAPGVLFPESAASG